MGKWYATRGLRKPSKYSAKAHKKRAQARKAAFHGTAAFAQTCAGTRRQKRGAHRGAI